MEKYVLKQYSCFYCELLKNYSNKLAPFDRGSLIHFSKHNEQDNFTESFFLERNIRILHEQQKKLSNNTSYNQTPEELCFLKDLAYLFFSSNEECLSKDAQVVLLKNIELFKQLICAKIKQIGAAMIQDYDWYTEHIYTDDYIETIENDFRKMDFLVRSEQRQQINLTELAEDAAISFRWLFAQIKIQQL